MQIRFACPATFIIFVILFPALVTAQGMYSFESTVPAEWNQVTNGSLSISNTRFKDSLKALKWNWLPGSVITVSNPKNLSAINPSTGGVYFWLYNESPQNDSLKMEFLNVSNAVACSFKVYINFKGWRCVWVNFKNDMKYTSSTRLGTMKLYAPALKTGTGALYIDMFDVQTSPIWSRTADFFVNITTNSVADDYVLPRKVAPLTVIKPLSDTIELNLVEEKLDKWMVDTSRVSPDVNTYQNKRINDLQNRIGWTKTRNFSPLWNFKFIRNTEDNTVTAIDTVTGIGKGLFPTASIYSPKINGFATGACLQLALDYRINNNVNSLKRCIDLFDWMYDQGWADSSAMGSLYGQQVRTTAWPQAFFLLRDVLPESTYTNTMNALYWHLQFGDTYRPYSPDMASANADFIRGLGVAKLIYALCIKDPAQRLSVFSFTRDFLNNASLPYAGFSDIYKTDYSAYHHGGPYVSEYGDDALHQSTIIYYLLDGSKYALSEPAYNQLRNTWLRFDFFSTNLRVPFALSGRGPNGSNNMQEHIQGISYLGATQKGKTDTALIATFKRLVNVWPSQLNSNMSNAGIGISFTNSVAGAKSVVRLLNNPIPANADPSGTVFMPYSGMFFGRNKGWLVGAKGFSKYHFDFEVITTDGVYSRYLSYGSVQISSTIHNTDNFTPDSSYDWIHIPATTAKKLTLAQINVANSSTYWRFSDQTFLGGLKLNDSTGAFSVNLHDITYDTSFRARKTMFYFGDMAYFMGSGITCKDASNPIHTTLFQNKRTTGLTRFFVNDQDVTNTGYSAASVGATTSIKDGLGNVYVVFPNTGHGLVAQKQSIASFNSGGAATPAKEYDLAYLEHGTNISNEIYRYALLFQPQQAAVNAMAGGNVVNVIQQDVNAHIAYHTTRKTFGFAFFNTASNVNKGIINRVYHPCIVMQQNNDDSTKLVSFTDPDMRSPNFNKNNLKIDSLDVDGKYGIQSSSNPDITIKFLGNGVSRLYFPTSEGFDYRVQLVPMNLSTTAFTPGNLAILRTATPSANGVAVNIDEYTANGVFVRSILIDSLYQPTANSSTEEGYLTLSGNGEYIGFTGYEKTSAQGLYSSRFDTLNRAVAFVKYDGSIMKKAILPDLDIAKSFFPKSLYTYDAKEFWLGYGHLSGNYGGIMYGNMSSANKPLPLKSVTKWKTGYSVRQLNINPADQLLYFNTANTKLNYFGSASLPNDSLDANAVPLQISAAGKGGAKGFCFLNKDTVQLLYQAMTNSSGPGIIKYRKNLMTSAWDSVGAYGLGTDSYLSLTATASASGITLYVIRKSNANTKGELVAVTDSWTGNMSASGEAVLIASTSANSQVFRSICMVPQVKTGTLLSAAQIPGIPSLQNGALNSLRISPNPAGSYIMIAYDKLKYKGSILQVFDLNGRMLKQVPIALGSTGIKMDVSELPKGWYTVRMVTPVKQLTGSFLKQ